MKDLFESIIQSRFGDHKIEESMLDNEDDIINQANDKAEKEAAYNWLAAHGFKNRTYVGFMDGPEGQHGLVDQMGEINLTKKDTERNIPEAIPTLMKCNRLFIKGFDGKTIPQRVIPSHVQIVMITNCPNLEELPKLPEEVNTFSIINCPKIKSLDGCPKKVDKLFKVDNCGKEFEWKDIHKACPGVKKQNAIY